MNWLRQNPKLGAVAIVAGCAVIAALYFIYTFQSEYATASEEYSEKTSTLARLRASKPFPDQANVDKVEAEVKEVEATLGELSAVLSKHSGAIQADLDPQKFQDLLNKTVSAITDAAQKSGTKLPEGFYLGFDKYRTEPPSVAAAPLLGQQLAAISSAVEKLIKARAESIDSLARRPLPAESADAPQDAGKKGAQDKKKPDSNGVHQLALAPFDIVFTADQARSHEAFMGILMAEPILFVRLVGIANSAPDPPAKGEQAKASTAIASADQAEETSRIPVLFGQEQITVALRLASLSGGDNAAPPKK